MFCVVLHQFTTTTTATHPFEPLPEPILGHSISHHEARQVSPILPSAAPPWHPAELSSFRKASPLEAPD